MLDARRFLVTIFASLALIAACGGGHAAAPAPEAKITPPANAATVLVMKEQTLGPVLTDGAGRALYAETGAAANACDARCLQTWPPLLTVSNLVASRGLNTDLIGTVDLGNGLVQVTFKGWRLHYFSGDTVRGSTGGQGKGGVWYLVGPDGQPVTGDSAAAH